MSTSKLFSLDVVVEASIPLPSVKGVLEGAGDEVLEIVGPAVVAIMNSVLLKDDDVTAEDNVVETKMAVDVGFGKDVLNSSMVEERPDATVLISAGENVENPLPSSAAGVLPIGVVDSGITS